MRDAAAAYCLAAPQAPARNCQRHDHDHDRDSLLTYNSHRRVRRPKLGGRQVYRPVRRHTLSRIDETPPCTRRPRSQSLQHSTDFSSTRPILRSRSNISADTSRSVPVCNESHEVANQNECPSPQYAEPKGYESASSYDRPASMSDLPVVVPVDPALGAYVPYPEYSCYRDDGRGWWRRRRGSAKRTNLYLAFMY